MVIIAVVFIFCLYSFVLYGNVANSMISLFQYIFRMDYHEAYNLYHETFRKYMDWILIIAIIVTFFVVFRIYLNWFAKYFEEINNGIDTLIDEGKGEPLLLLSVI